MIGVFVGVQYLVKLQNARCNNNDKLDCTLFVILLDQLRRACHLFVNEVNLKYANIMCMLRGAYF